MDANEVASYLAEHEAQNFHEWEISSEGTNSWRPCHVIPALRLIPFGLPAIPANLGFTSQQLEWLESILPKKTPPQESREEDTFVVDEAPRASVAQSLSLSEGHVETEVEPLVQSASDLQVASFANTLGSLSPPPSAINEPKTNPEERRKEPRFTHRLQVVLISDQNAFRTFTKNISIHGFCAEHEVPPEFLEIECTIFLTRPSSTSKLKVSGQLQRDPEGARRVVFSKISAEDQQTLLSWISVADGRGLSARKIA